MNRPRGFWGLSADDDMAELNLATPSQPRHHGIADTIPAMSEGVEQVAADDASSYEAREAGELDYVGAIVKRALTIAVLLILLAVLAPSVIDQLLEIISDAERLRTIRPWWFLLMVVFEIASFACIWWLTRIVLPRVSWFVAATCQLTANSASRLGSAALGGATLFRMLSASGVNAQRAAGALAATSIVSTAALFSIPAMGLAIAFFGAPIPEDMLYVAVASGVLFLLLVSVGAAGILFTKPLLLIGRVLDRGARLLNRMFRTAWRIDPDDLVAERNRLAGELGERWPQATAASALNWMFDYLVLVAALYAVDANPRLSLVMVAYASGAVLGMIPITPGGLGFVEAGLIATLVLSGISFQDATTAVLAYRVVSFVLPLAAGPFAWVAFRRRFPRRADAAAA